MEMVRFEKWWVNRNKKAERNIARVRHGLAELPAEAIQDVLELGCGIGAVAAFMSKTYPMTVWGTDYDPQQIQIARRRHPENERLTYRMDDTHLSTAGQKAQSLLHRGRSGGIQKARVQRALS